jgi:hypothetical protein
MENRGMYIIIVASSTMVADERWNRLGLCEF